MNPVVDRVTGVTGYSVVLDLGQHTTKAGFAGENHPSLVFPTIVGVPKYQQIGMGREKPMFVGDEMGDAMGLYKISHPLKNGRVEDFPQVEKVLDYIFYSLHVDPTTVNVLFSHHPLMPADQRRKLYEIFFEKYQVVRFYPAMDALLTLYSGGFTTGLVVELGDSCTRVVPFYEGYRIDPAVRIMDVGGAHLTEFMRQELVNFGFSAKSSVERDLVRAIKERGCFVSLDFEEDSAHPTRYDKVYVLPDGSRLKVNSPRFRVPELLFRPSLGYLESPGLVNSILDSVEACDVDVREEMLNHVFLSGGSSMFPNLDVRLQQDLEVALVQRGYQNVKVKIFAAKERQFAPWVGGSILSLIPEFYEQWIDRAAYFRNGVPE
ncbi:MAG: hypothetical protein Kow0069_36170 [Promethearchaeota archaeon]